MACSIAENEPLKALRNELGIPNQCHSLRKDCFHKLNHPVGNYTLGIPGAAIGYCQALFRKESGSKEHTEFIVKELEKINAPWSKSHELYWGNKINESTEDFLKNSVEPLLGEGRMPVLITPLDPKNDIKTIREIASCSPFVFEGETTLIRIVLSDTNSIDNISELMQEILKNCRDKKEMPRYWFLLQATGNFSDWIYLQIKMGNDFRYVNIAVNPFTISNLPDFCNNNITVAQVILGDKEGIENNGNISLPAEMKITGAKECDSYNIFEYFKKLDGINTAPTLIVLGPSLPEWTNIYNAERIETLLPIMQKACDGLWDGVSVTRRKMVWELTA